MVLTLSKTLDNERRLQKLVDEISVNWTCYVILDVKSITKNTKQLGDFVICTKVCFKKTDTLYIGNIGKPVLFYIRI